MSVKENLQNIRKRIEKAALAVDRDPRDIKLIGAIKNVPTALVKEAISAGLTDIGENKVQEAGARYDEIQAEFSAVTWHMIGHLQRNKVRQALDLFDIIQSLDSLRLAQEIEQRAEAKGKGIPVLVEVNTSAETSKYGVGVESAVEFLKTLSTFKNLRVEGLMTIAPLTEDPEKARPPFVILRKLSEAIKQLNLPNVEMKYLSMGMTDDFEVAIQEGANMLRIGRAIFGERRG